MPFLRGRRGTLSMASDIRIIEGQPIQQTPFSDMSVSRTGEVKGRSRPLNGIPEEQYRKLEAGYVWHRDQDGVEAPEQKALRLKLDAEWEQDNAGTRRAKW